ARWIGLRRPRVGGGPRLVAAEVKEPEGLRDVRLADVSRRELRIVRERLQRETGLRLVPADWRVLDALVVEGQRQRSAGDVAPDRARDYLRVRPQPVTTPPAAPAEPRPALGPPPPQAGRPPPAPRPPRTPTHARVPA